MRIEIELERFKSNNVFVANSLALGTVQFGLPYGISNLIGQVNYSEAQAILQRAKKAGLDTLDTAIAYGESERCLGNLGVNDWKIISKLPEFDGSDIKDWVKEQVYGSLERLGVSKLYGLLLHHPVQLLKEEGELLWLELQQLKRDGIVEKIGFSIYEPNELELLWSRYHPDLVQAPYNILDRRLSKSGWLQRMYDDGVEVHIRSIFLQGLLLMEKNERPNKFDRWSAMWEAWHEWLQQQGITALQACLSFTLHDPRISRVVVGVDSLEHVEEILSSTDISIKEFPEKLETNDLDLIIPSRWNNL